jgi:hypothetical protein
VVIGEKRSQLTGAHGGAPLRKPETGNPACPLLFLLFFSSYLLLLYFFMLTVIDQFPVIKEKGTNILFQGRVRVSFHKMGI